ncbi:unnamed protein product [Notodromas monacha]|uniref:C1q domain-containing protein n=1 Tax=Notodromas monacha TaxID=399045 RepID=A0A7R9BFT3_9CRUS|nr:unnamed protein product [Notodromas monacha]CAG0914654.1 unnamed protein product [Notodromas monacha]
MLQISLRFAVLLLTTIFVTSDAEGSAHEVTLHHPKIELQGTGDVLDILHSQPIFPNEPVVFSVYGVRQNSSDFLTDTSYWKAITYNLRGVTLGSCFDMKKGEFVVSVPGFYEFRWEAEKGTWGLPGELYILKNDQDVFGRGFANEKTKITVRTFAQVWLNAGDRVSTRYKGQFSGGDVANAFRCLVGRK